ncbi:UDP-2,3-diacylglucosamine diphosphatase [Methylobacillus caricis]|uniref:UDP-2,3-diacylglucosamine diphosphatase n=1 Tax=Methylobacillus caricis TaxID=1971611 RepID=UPI001CFFE790|nr:UDP-2,3-diacylglucosamine diphosphatase [Methylobacillus caricis]MCB5186583.1 UDP-2,3-diacylglucosamine diphosphatase [Methylobacillus caricis]
MVAGIGNTQAHSLFISDLHLCSSRPAITAQFLEFLQHIASQAEALYILGDFFEYWAGDDDLAQHQTIIRALHTLVDKGTHTFFMHGNRDFLIGNDFAKAAGITLLEDPTLLEIYGKRILLSHGDALCTDDVAYQAFRQQVRNHDWQQAFLQQTLASRKAQIEALRKRSEEEKSGKQENIMDVNQDAVHALIRQFEYPQVLIHGHTHRPALHKLVVDGHEVERWVLGDWYDQGSCLRLDHSGLSNQLL